MKLPAILWLCLLSFSITCQETLKFEHIPLAKGLSNKAIPAIIQDHKGYLWFATQDGLNRYDGYSFKVYQNNPADKNSLSNNNIFCLFQDSEGLIWIGTEGGGLNRFDPEKEEFKQYLNNPNDPHSISSNQVYCITEKPGGELWLGTWDAGINIFDRKTERFSQIKNNPTDSNSLAKAGIWQIYFDKKNHAWISLWGQGADRLDLATGKFRHFKHIPLDTATISNPYCGLFHEDSEGFIWITTWGGALNRFDPATETFKRYLPDPRKPGSIGGLKAWPIVEDKKGDLWIGIYGSGLNKFDKKTGRFTVYAHDDNNPHSPALNDIWSLFIDRSGILWIGTEGGGIDMCPMINKPFNFLTQSGNPGHSLAEKSVRGICTDSKGNVWFATWLEGIDKLDPETGTVTHYKNSNTGGETGLNRIRCLFRDKDEKIWFGSYRGGLGSLDPKTGKFNYYYTQPDTTGKTETESKYVISILEDKKGNFWVSSLNSLHLFDKQNQRFTRVPGSSPNSAKGSNTVNKIFESADGRIWFGSNLGLFHYVNNAFTAFPLFTEKKEPVPVKTIYDICEDNAGSLWLATRSGLTKVDKKTGTCREYTTKNGLPINTLYSIQCDRSGNLWSGTGKGLSKFNPKEQVFVNFNLSDGLNNLLFYPSASCHAADGTLYFGGSEGVNYFNPAKIEINTCIPPVWITGFLKFDEPVNFKLPPDKLKIIELDYNENIFTFLFVALNYASPEKNQYAYKLENFDKDWRYCGTATRADYSGLPPGNYLFHVRASNNDGVWNENGASIQLVIYPPFWETIWFRVTVLTVLMGLICLIYQVRMRAIRKRNILLEKTVKERTEEVVHQKEQLEEQKKEIVDSIQYAKRIQTAILPDDGEWKKISGNYFVFFKPKDIVSGDFYWAHTTSDNKAIWAVADCTGHGVPGAFMSMIGNSFLNEIIVENKIHNATAILNTLRAKIMKSLEHKVGGEMQKDGMDLALCIWDKKNNTIEFAGANNPLYIVRDGILTETKSNKMPIGYYINMQPFQSTVLEVKEGDTVYSFSDGFADQFGGDKGKKFKYAQLKELLIQTQNQHLSAQKNKLEETFEKWKGQYEQLDDVCIVGVKIKNS